MNSDTARRRDSCSRTMGLLPLVAVGGLFGYLLVGNVYTAPLRQLAASFSLGLVWAYVFLQWVDLAAEYLALKADPVPLALEVGDRAAVKEQLAKLDGCSFLQSRIRHLLQSWSLGWHPRQVLGLAGFQSAQARGQLYAGVIFALLLLLTALRLQGGFQLTWAGMLAVGVTVFARQHLLLRLDRYIECRLLARLPANIPQTAMTAADLAGALGGSIQTAFKNYVPQPDQMAAAMRAAMEGAMQQVAGAIEKLQKSLGEGQGALAENWAKTFSSATGELKGLQEALKTAAGDLKGGLASGAEQWKGMLQSHSQSLDKSLAAVPGQLAKTYAEGAGQVVSAFKEHAEKMATGTEQWKAMLQGHAQSLDKSLAAVPGQLAKTYAEGAGQVVSAFKEHAEKITAASEGLQAQLDRIAQLGKEIEKVLHVQQTVDGTLKAVAATEEFRRTLETLNKHVEASDALLREAAKPRTIRLVESDGEAAQG
jgi:ABC-type transporter Mla subunit MlaD